MSEIFKIYRKILNKRQKRMCVWLSVLGFIGSLLECLGLSLVIPAIAVLSDMELPQEFAFLQSLFGDVNRVNAGAFAAKAFSLMCIIYLLKNLYLAVVSHIQIRFIKESQLGAQKEIIDGTIYCPYLFHMQKDTPELMQRLDTEVMCTYQLLDKLLLIMSEGMVVIVLAILLAVTNLPMTLAVLLLYGIVLGLIQFLLKPYLRRESVKAYQLKQGFQKWLLQTVSCIKIIKAEKLETYFSEHLKETAKEAIHREIRVAFIQSLPHKVLELASICGILGIAAIFLGSGVDSSQVLNQLAVLAVVAVRMLPSVSRITSYTNFLHWNVPLLKRCAQALEEARSKEIQSEYVRSEDAYDMETCGREAPVRKDGNTACKEQTAKTGEQSEVYTAAWEKIKLMDVCFQYPNSTEPVLEQLNLTVMAGRMFGIMGLSGAGKTTLVDIMLGLLKPQKGQVCVDSRNLYEDEELMKNWSKRISYIPQNISLLDGSIRENVLFGREDFGDEKIWEALKEAQLADYVRELPEGLNTKVGEYGLRLSGGQRQRIGIARAFYKQADILVLDEATSALDYGTEQKIMELVQTWKGERTVIMITHRLEVLSVCDEVIAVSGRKAEEWSRKE